MDEQQSERDFLFQELSKLLDHMQRYAARPERRSRLLSLAVTNVEQGRLWLGEHIATEVDNEVATQDAR